MGALAKIPTQISEAEYLAHYTQTVDVKYEYINGEIWAMGGTSIAHNIIAGNVFSAFRAHLRATPCISFMETIKVKVEQNYYYIDVVVNCHEFQGATANQPILIVEVLSDSTRKTDLTFKLYDYQKIPTLQEYCVIEQEFNRVAIYRRADNWKATEYAFNAEIPFESIGLMLTVADIYESVVFAEN